MSRDWILSAMPLAVMLVSLGVGVIVDGTAARADTGVAAAVRAETVVAEAAGRVPCGLAGIRIS